MRISRAIDKHKLINVATIHYDLLMRGKTPGRRAVSPPDKHAGSPV